MARGIALVDAGHYGTERVVVPAIAGYLEGRAKEAGCDLEVVISRVKTDPFRHL
jgi:putative NIF3 family GTP cyclohydrolase 1 type 2